MWLWQTMEGRLDRCIARTAEDRCTDFSFGEGGLSAFCTASSFRSDIQGCATYHDNGTLARGGMSPLLHTQPCRNDSS